VSLLFEETKMSDNYYVVLGISTGADVQKIKKAYRNVAKKYHPDLTDSRENKEKFLKAKEAYETLTDEKKRRQYDENLSREESVIRISRVHDTIKRRTSWWKEMERLFLTTTDDFFEGFVPGFFDLQKSRLNEKDLFYEALLSPQEAYSGGIYPLSVPVIESCPRCNRVGLVNDFYCPNCSGYGRVLSERVISLIIPPRVSHGTQIQLSLEDIGLNNTYLNILVTVN
jgi:molecular chaperone DnaJ